MKEYCNICDECDYRIIANRKYVTLQELLRHKDEKHTKACSECDYKARNLQDMRRHLRDVHGIITGSTSPPTKRKRRQSTEKDGNDENIMDVDCDDNASDKSVQFEDMEIESFGATEEETPDERRAKMDKKIEDKKKQMEQDEIVKENLKREIESMKKAVRKD